MTKRSSRNRSKATAKPKAHEQRDWREAWNDLWFAITCAMEARREIDDRDWYLREWDRVAARCKLFIDARQSLIDGQPYDGVVALPAVLMKELGIQIERDERRLNELNMRSDSGAFVGETVESATARRALLRGKTGYAWGRLCNPHLPSSEIPDTAEKKTGYDARTLMLDYYNRRLEYGLDLLEDDQLGWSVFRPIGEVFQDRRGRIQRSCFATRQDLERDVEKVRRLIDSLTTQKGAAKRKGAVREVTRQPRSP